MKTLNGKVLLSGLIASAYLFGKTKFDYEDSTSSALKIGSHASTNIFWGASICSFLINFLPQVNLGLVLPICFTAAFFDSAMVMKTYRPGVEGTDSVIAWFYSNETTFAAANLFGAIGLLTGLGVVMLQPNYVWLKGDLIQVLSVASTVLTINAFATMSSMKVLDRDFKYEPYNKWDASMTYIWRIVPHIYIPVDYFDINRQIAEQGERKLFKHPVYSWVEEYENAFLEEKRQDALLR